MNRDAHPLGGDPSPLLIVISGPSGVGKTTLARGLLAGDPAIVRVVTCTTRAPRGQERHGVDYYFLAPEEFERRAAAGDFLEHAAVFGHRYGTLKSEVLSQLQQGHDVLLNIDVQGAANVRERAREAPGLNRALFTVFVAPPSLAELERRLRGRGEDLPEVIARRLDTARRELAAGEHFDHRIVSAGIPEDLRQMQAIVQAERQRRRRSPAKSG